jgi:tyrocidine synthetase-3
MYILNRLSPESTEYNVPVALRLEGKLDVRRLRQALSALVARHSGLRTSFGIAGEEVVQRIKERVSLPLPLRDAKSKGEIEEINQSFVRPFDLHRAPLLRTCLVRLEKAEHVLLLDLHHIICDAVSVDILLDELGRLYGGQSLPELQRQYQDFALWQRRFAKTAEARKQEDYWLQLLDGRHVLNLPTDYLRKRDQSQAGDRVFVRPGKELTAALRSLAVKNRTSMFMLLLSAYNILLSKYAGQEDIIVGTLVAGRRAEEFQGVVGLFVNTLLLRSQPQGELEFVEYLKQVRGECLNAFEHQDYQFEDLVDRINPPRDLGRNPLFDTMFGALSYDGGVSRHGGVDFSLYELDYQISKFELSLTQIEGPDQRFVLEFEYRTDLFRRQTIERLSGHYLNILEEIAADPRVKLSDINILTARERQRLVLPPVPNAASPNNVADLFRAQARKAPAAPALSSRGETLSYGELDRRSNALVQRLREQGVDRGDLVGLVAPPSFEMIIAILGVLKLGAAYLPLDPTTPGERFRKIAADARMAALLIAGDPGPFAWPGLAIMQLDKEAWSAVEELPALPAIDSQDLAYVIYTSGSTGTPKGVMVSHGALANYITWATKTYVGQEKISFALHSPLSVDLTVTSIFVPLVSGNRIVIYRLDDAVALIEDIIRDNQVELIKLTPTHLSLLGAVDGELDRNGSRLRKIIVGGEDLKTSLAAKIHASFGGRIEIFNEYGPTEATVGCMIHKYEPRTDTALSVPIGQAIDNTGIYLLDQYGHPVPEGVTGELCVAGVCLARGYLNNPLLTDERFVMNRIGPTPLRMYKTGDLARTLPDGNIEYLGRNDDQVKIRGFRIELGEIEASLLRFPQIKEALVTTRVDAAGDTCLCAYFVADGEIPATELRAGLAEYLPPYMIPAWFVPLRRFAIARGGKLDKKELPDPLALIVSSHTYTAPRSKTETVMARIWEQVLGVGRVGIDDNFFELGGQSLKAIFMTGRANRELKASISLRDVFAQPTIRKLAARVELTGEDSPVLIEPVGEREYYPVSSAQERLYILNQLAPADVQYNVPWAMEITGPFDAERWEQAFGALIARHEPLRTSFALVDERIVQKVHQCPDFAFEYISSTGEAAIQQEIERFVRPFDLSKAPLIRAAIVKSGESVHSLIVDMHHIVSDGISVEIILDELCSLYRRQTLEPPAIQYKDYAAWQRARSQSEAVLAQGAYWTELFAGELPVLNLATDYPRQAVQSFEGGLVTFQADTPTVEGLRAICRDCGATMHMILLAAYTVLLSKYAGQEDIIVGTPVVGRNEPSLERVVGMFVNTLAMRNQPRGELTFREFLRLVRSNALDAYANQEYQFEELVDKLMLDRNLSRNPLFDTVFASLDEGSEKFEIDGLTVKRLNFEWKISKFDLTLLAAEGEERLDFELEYCAKLFRKDTMERLSLHYRNILEQIVHHPDRKIADLDPLTEEERREILIGFNPSASGYPAQRSIHEIFEEQVDKNPDNVAVVYGNLSLSYLEINGRANQVARALVSKGVAREEVVGIIAGPSLEMIVGILAILKAGCAFLPIDPDCPEDRVRTMLKDSGAQIVLEAGGAKWRDASRLVLDLGDPGLYGGDDSNLAHAVYGRDLAYVIYTSGTTGAPKGVMIEHHSVNNLCAWHINTFGVTAADRATKYALFSFDASVWEIFPYLQAGAALHVIKEAMRLDLPRLNRYFEEKGITICFLPTQVCELFMELDNKSLRTLLTGGDRLRRLRPKSYQVVNNYGPTEDTVVATSCTVRIEEERIPIGKPVANTRVYLLGKANEVVPIGAPGELCIAGVGLARGYLNDALRTAEKFAADPFVPGERMYRTGDVAKWLPDGSLEFIGRTDNQVKIRGCRTELREIEGAILAHEAVQDAVVVPREDKENNKFLCAYIVWREAAQLAELRAHLARHLPDYMVPAFLLTVDAIPLNPRGKIDTTRLPNPEASLGVGQGYVAPRSDTEKRLAEIWRSVLDRKKIGIHDRFFEIGGDSLRATIMLAKANREFDASVPLGAVFDNQSLALLARCFENVTKHESMVLQAAESRVHYSVTPTQALLYALCSSRKGVEYNLPTAFELHGDLDVPRLENAFRQLIHRHETLRTSFRTVGGQPRQWVSPRVDFAISVLEGCGEDEIEEVARDFIRPFDLGVAPLLRAALVPLGPGRQVLLMDMHHLVSDGTSMGILFEEMAALYAGEELPEPGVTFKDFAEWIGEHLQSEPFREKEKYWLSVLEDPPPLPRLDTDFPRPQNFSSAGTRITFETEPWVQSALKTFCAEHEVTLFMALLAAYGVLLSKYSRQEDIIVAVPTAGRYIAEVQKVVGMFVSTHLVRSRPQSRLRFDQYLAQVRTAVRGALECQEYQLWGMMLGHMLRSGGQPLFNTVFVVQDQSFSALEMPGLTVREMDVGYPVAKFDLALGAVETDGKLEFEMEYNTDLFRRSTAKRLAANYLQVLKQVITEPGRELGQIEVLTKPEKERILCGFNGGVVERAGGENVVSAFEGQAEQSPDRVALVLDDKSMTYGELNRRANQLARYLRRQGIGAGDIVGVMVRPSFEMIMGLLAVLKTGAAYLPLSQGYPWPRIERLLAASGARLVLGHAAAEITPFTTPFVDLGDEKNYDPNGSNLEPLRDAGGLAYVSYVAKPTGAWKGVMIEHRSLFDRCRWHTERFAVSPDDRSAKYGDLTANATIFEVFPFLAAGASIGILTEGAGRDAKSLDQYLAQSRVTIAWLPAPLCHHLAPAENTALRVLITSGRNVSPARKGSYEFVKCFGHAENTEVTTCCPVNGDGAGGIIGKPITNSEVYILGHDGGLLPIGVTGELCVGGAGLARGYWDRGDETAPGFTMNPYAAGSRMYRTGVWARWLPDGRIELTGRPDEVSIDGHRVSLAEIEGRLRSHPGIEDAVVVFDDEVQHRERLVAFLVLGGGVPAVPQLFVEEVKLHLGRWLPGYMIPDNYIQVGMIPRAAGGPVQYEWLPMPERPADREEIAVPPAAIAKKVASMVEELLGVGPVGMEANLFDLGLTSLGAANLMVQINSAFGIAPSVCLVSMAPTISSISHYLSETLWGQFRPLTSVEMAPEVA